MAINNARECRTIFEYVKKPYMLHTYMDGEIMTFFNDSAIENIIKHIYMLTIVNITTFEPDAYVQGNRKFFRQNILISIPNFCFDWDNRCHYLYSIRMACFTSRNMHIHHRILH
ncbi:MAG: hypothetical protein Pg6B_09360 [Candidatus Azobacteroides pseudotrichonymphae]|nr:MAG: hypothetical protein Pg6B_09360 [Candidatus Azobacteroides pseudotrichonymphae]